MNLIATSIAAATTFSTPLSNIEFNMLALSPKEVETKLDSIILFTPSDKDGMPISFEFDSDGSYRKMISDKDRISSILVTPRRTLDFDATPAK